MQKKQKTDIIIPEPKETNYVDLDHYLYTCNWNKTYEFDVPGVSDIDENTAPKSDQDILLDHLQQNIYDTTRNDFYPYYADLTKILLNNQIMDYISHFVADKQKIGIFRKQGIITGGASLT